MATLQLSDLIAALWRELSDDGANWLSEALEQLAGQHNNPDSLVEQHLCLSAIAKRKLGCAQISDLPGPAKWQLDEAGRLLLLHKLLELSPACTLSERVKTAFKCGDESEQITLIKGLELIDEHGLVKDLAIAAGRTNSLNLFAAIALNNGYAVKHYPQGAFHQLVLKALFMDLDISQMIGLKQQLCPQLSALAMDLVNERLAAGRQPPGAIWLAIDFSHLGQADKQTFLRFNPK